VKLTTKRRELIAAVRSHATENYNNGGWDVIVECYDDEAIVKVIGRARTVKGALAKFAPVIDVLADRQAAADSERHAAVGNVEHYQTGCGCGPEFATVEHYRTGSEFSYDRPGCGCGQEFATDKAADLHVAKTRQADGTYDRLAQGYHPDGSFVSWRHDEHSGDAWATRSWEGRSGRGHIAIVETDEGFETVETYAPGWRGAVILTADYCNHRPAPEGSLWACGGDHCNFAAHPECEPPF
jgi:hypothetical protein